MKVLRTNIESSMKFTKPRRDYEIEQDSWRIFCRNAKNICKTRIQNMCLCRIKREISF